MPLHRALGGPRRRHPHKGLTLLLAPQGALEWGGLREEIEAGFYSQPALGRPFSCRVPPGPCMPIGEGPRSSGDSALLDITLAPSGWHQRGSLKGTVGPASPSGTPEEGQEK